ncbi:transposable element Tcb2 transposase [Trichonephila clavipes]|nr:transposable element Tcb2 transposase [Trichonephila clavipes]
MKYDFQLKGRQGWSAFSDCFVSMSTVSQRSHLTDSEAWRVVGRKCRPKPGQSHRWSTTLNEDRYLVLMARRHRNMNTTLLQQHLRSATGTTVSTQTVRNWTHGVGLYARRPMVCVRLTSRHHRDRREWATEHMNWRRNEWGSVFFSNESRFSVHPNNRRIFIWRERGSRNTPAYVHERVRFGSGGCWCMVASPLSGAQTYTSFEMDL